MRVRAGRQWNSAPRGSVLRAGVGQLLGVNVPEVAAFQAPPSTL